MTVRADAAPARAARRRPAIPRQGWLIVAAKEIGDHVTSARFAVLLVILAFAVGVPLFFASARIRDLAEAASGQPAVFLALFTVGAEEIPILRVAAFVAFLAPLLGIAFGFDSVNVERSEGTLPRLLSQPIYRDDVINGKFAAGLAVVSLVLASLTAFLVGFGIVRLGIGPGIYEVVRIVAWLALTIVYVGAWLAFATLLSVVIRRPATAALVAFGTWVGITVYGQVLAATLAEIVAPTRAVRTVEDFFRNVAIQDFLIRLSPSTLYQEAAVTLLNPTVTSTTRPTTIGQLLQSEQQIPTYFSLDQSLMLVWPHVVALIALTVVSFGAAYVLFMRQEIRA